MAARFIAPRIGSRCARYAWAIGVTVLLTFLSSGRASGQISPGPLARPHASLEGATNCVKCHGLKGSGSPMSQVCLQCHKEIGWLVQQGRGLHAREVRVARKECASCHPDHAGADFKLVEWPEGAPSKFDHRRAGWALAGKHADAKCESCHATKYRTGEAARLSERRQGAGWVGLERDCVSCHKTDDVHANALGANCASCHDANAWDKAPGFDHDKADFRLDGKHQDVSCNACHLTPRLKTRTDARGERIPLFKPIPYKECSACHADPHGGRLSSTCSSCHVTRGFDVVDKTDFNHAMTRYPLKGAHAGVSCDGCHGKDMSRRSPSFASCASCHADVHNGGATVGGRAVDCASCHRVESFTTTAFTTAQHRETNYPLEGRHESVACAKCHTAKGAGATSAASGGTSAVPAGRGATTSAARAATVRFRLDASSCASCHDDAHGGELAAVTGQHTCESCHAVRGFAPSTFGVAEHARLRLPLDGAHATITCAACHGATRPGLPAWGANVSFGTAKVRLTGLDPSCASCHVDPHAGRFAAAGGTGGRGCTSCHDTRSFRPSTVDIAAHGSFAMPLEGAHRAVPCVACHAEMSAEPQSPPATPAATRDSAAASTSRKNATVTSATRSSAMHGGATLILGGGRFPALPFTRSTPRGCASCHETPHGDQFDTRPDKGRCESCHSLETFTPAAGFDHERTRFTLAGAHATVPCASCHTRVAAGGTSERVRYRPLSTACESCHTSRGKREGA